MKNHKKSEQNRLENQRVDKEDWRLWGPYLSERAWGTVREDYSADGEAWEYFKYDQARSRAYRWNEDGIGGICDVEQRLCLALTLWNGCDPFLKERMFGLSMQEGNHGEDVKECFFYLDATPSHSFLRYLYKYPQTAFPYDTLKEENRRRTPTEPPFGILDTGVFDENRYWDVEITYAKKTPECIYVRITASNRGPEEASLHLLPTLWFRNTWSWDAEPNAKKPSIQRDSRGKNAWAVRATHPTLGNYFLNGRQRAKLLFTDNESNTQRLFGSSNASPYVKDGFHRLLIHSEQEAVNTAAVGTKFAAWYEITCVAGESAVVDLVLTCKTGSSLFSNMEKLLRERRLEADEFYKDLAPGANREDALIFRQAMAGMIWCKQFFHFDVSRWLDGDQVPPPAAREQQGRNQKWRHMKAADIISMPDGWEYPWFAAWDLAYQCMVFAYLDVDFAKEQIELLLTHRYLHPNGQLPAYEWDFSDDNPPIHAVAALKVFRAERKQRGEGDLHFLRRVFHKLIMNYTWWLNRKDGEGLNVFEGGFMGLDNISVYDRSKPLPAGYSLKQADATGWMAMFALNMTAMALELAQEMDGYEEMAIQCYQQFLAIANAIAGHASTNLPLWDPEAGFFKDILVTPAGKSHRIDVYSYVGLVPLLACELITPEVLKNVPRFKAILDEHQGGMFDGHTICLCPFHTNENGERLLAIVDHTMIPQILQRLLNEHEFLAGHGIRSVSKIHDNQPLVGLLPILGETFIQYEPGESTSYLFGGNSNWRGPVWIPISYSILQALTKYHRFLGSRYTVNVPALSNQALNLREIANLIAEGMITLFRRDENGLVPSLPQDSPFQKDPYWRDLRLFHEYFHGDSGIGLGASHQTGWTGLVANLIKRRCTLALEKGKLANSDMSYNHDN